MNNIAQLYIDLFCGAGGTSTGVEFARVNGNECAKVIACVNHDANAIASHAANHPEALHFTEDIRTLNLSPLAEHVLKMKILYPNAKVVLWASLECTNFSNAKGGQSRDADSRTLAEHLFRYIEAINPDYIEIENVKEFMTWGPLIIKTSKTKLGAEYCPCNVKKGKKKVIGKDGELHKSYVITPQMVPDPEKKGVDYRRWVNQVKQCGYLFDKRILDAADYAARTSRKRFFGIFAKEGLPIVFPEPTHSKNGGNDLFDKRKKWNPVKDALDLSDEGESIFGRKKEYVEPTKTRLYSGLIRFVAGGKDAFMVKWNSMNRSGGYIAPGIDDPCPTVSCQNRLGVARVNFLSKQFGGSPDGKSISVEQPAGAITCIDHHAMVSANFLAAYYGSGDNVSSVEAPCPTVPTKDRFNYVQPKFMCSYNYKDGGKDINQPCPTLLTKDRLALVSPFFMNYYSAGGQLAGADKPCPAVTTVPKQRLVSPIFIDQQYGQSKPASPDRPLGCVTGNPKYALVTPWLMNTNFGNVGSSINSPSPVVTANRKWHYLVNPQYSNSGGDIDSPCFTLIARMDKAPPYLAECTTERREDVPSFIRFEGNMVVYEIYDTDSPMTVKIKEFMAMYGILDIKMRMLRIPELKRIMGFPEEYVLFGSQADQKKFIGNAVEVNMARVMCEAICSKLLEKQKVAA